MQIVGGGGGRANYFDRAVINRHYNYDADAVAPHAVATRAEYTVASSQIAIVEFVFLYIRRATIAAVLGLVRARVNVLATVPNTYGSMGAVILTTNVAGDYVQLTIPCGVVLVANEKIQVTTEDASTGGTVDYKVAFKVTSFNV